MSVTQMEELPEQSLNEERTKSSQQGKRNPPARNTSRFWFERFLSVIQRQNPSVIDSTFLSQIAPSNEGKLLAQLKFLHVIDEQGRPTQLLSMLNMVGEEQKKGFLEIAKSSYQDLLSEVKLERAVPDDLVNFFIRKYGFTRDKAINAVKFFLYMAEKGSIQVSQELNGLMAEKPSMPAQNGASQSASSRIIRPIRKETRSPPSAFQVRQSSRKNADSVGDLPAIQAMINIKLDKDTPKEYWDRVFALLGEQRVEVNVNSEVKNEESDEQDS